MFHLSWLQLLNEFVLKIALKLSKLISVDVSFSSAFPVHSCLPKLALVIIRIHLQYMWRWLHIIGSRNPHDTETCVTWTWEETCDSCDCDGGCKRYDTLVFPSTKLCLLSRSLFQGENKLHQPRLVLNQAGAAGDALPSAADGAAGGHAGEPPRPALPDWGSAGRQGDQREHQRIQAQERSR